VATVHCDGCGRTYETPASLESIEVVKRCGYCGRELLHVLEEEAEAGEDVPAGAETQDG
jgi:hypothetical protein